MIKQAYLYKDELKIKFAEASFDPDNMYFYTRGYVNYEYEISDDSWSNIQVVSVCDNEILGYMSASIVRSTRHVNSLHIINFTKEPFTFARDLFSFLNSLLFEYNFYKINFSVVVGNPAEKMYDKFVDKFGGRIVGTFKDDAQTWDGEMHDQKHYEIIRDDAYEMLHNNDIVVNFNIIMKDLEIRIAELNKRNEELFNKHFTAI